MASRHEQAIIGVACLRLRPITRPMLVPQATPLTLLHTYSCTGQCTRSWDDHLLTDKTLTESAANYGYVLNGTYQLMAVTSNCQSAACCYIGMGKRCWGAWMDGLSCFDRAALTTFLLVYSDDPPHASLSSAVRCCYLAFSASQLPCFSALMYVIMSCLFMYDKGFHSSWGFSVWTGAWSQSLVRSAH